MRPIKKIIEDYDWVHTGLGIVGNVCFLVGSVLFLWESTKTAGVWLFIAGASGMLIGSVGSAVAKAERRGTT